MRKYFTNGFKIKKIKDVSKVQTSNVRGFTNT